MFKKTRVKKLAPLVGLASEPRVKKVRSKNLPPLESKIEKEILTYLRLSDWLAFKINSAGIYNEYRNAYMKNNSPLHITGKSDLLLLKKGRVFFVEVKRPGKKQSANQIEFQAKVEHHGGIYFVADSVSNLKDKLALLAPGL